jgi:asparagine synthase (glutamine-hydrolysing)
LKILGYPVEYGIANYHEPFYQLAEKFSVRTMLSGFGGDEFVTTTHGYMVPMKLMMSHQYKALYDILPGPPMIKFLRLLKLGYKKIKSRGFTQPEYHPRLYEAYSQRWPHNIVRQELVDKYKLKQRYFDEARFNAEYTDLKKFILENRWAPFVPTRMENCTLMAAARKIEYRWPLLDVRLVKLFLSIPAKENYFRGMGRYLHRRAIDGVVPDLVTWKQSKNMGNQVRVDCSVTKKNQDTFSITDLPKLLKECIDVETAETQQAEIFGNVPRRVDNFSLQSMSNRERLKYLSYWLSLQDCFM